MGHIVTCRVLTVDPHQIAGRTKPNRSHGRAIHGFEAEYCAHSPTFLPGGAMNRTVARLNIEHYRKLLAGEMDDAKRQTILRLLAEEEAKLAMLDKQDRKKKG
jgi:hypothetical protein